MRYALCITINMCTMYTGANFNWKINYECILNCKIIQNHRDVFDSSNMLIQAKMNVLLYKVTLYSIPYTSFIEMFYIKLQ